MQVSSTVRVGRALACSGQARPSVSTSGLRRSHFLSRPARSPHVSRPPCATSANRRDAEVAARQEASESPFLEPFLRGLVLGVGAAVLLESAHEVLQILSQGGAASGDVREALQALPPPLFVADHVTAICGWLGFYLIEAGAIAAVLKSYAGDTAAAMPAIRRLTTLPKKMLPLKLQLVKSLFVRSTGSLSTASAAAGTSPAPPAAAAAPSLPAASAFSDSSQEAAGVDVLPKAQYPPTLPLPKAPQQPAGPGSEPPSPKHKAKRTPKGTSNIVPGPTTAVPGPIATAAPGNAEAGALAERRRSQGLRPGQWDPTSASSVRRQKELVDRSSYLTNVWYCAALSKDVKAGKPHAVHMLGKQFVLFRGQDGKVQALDDTCPHRGAPLSGGWLSRVDGHDCVTCPYHGWAIDATGVLRDVPAAEKGEGWPKRPIVPAFPAEERGGFVWVYYAGQAGAEVPMEERPPIPCVPELEDPSWKAVYGEIEFDAPHHGVFENALDMAHIHYLHGDSFGNADQPEIQDMQVTSDKHSITATFKIHNKPVNPLWEFSKVPVVHVTASAMLGSTSVVSFTLAQGISFITFVNTIPINANKSVNRFCLVRKMSTDATGIFNADAWDVFAYKAMMKIQGEDKEMVEQLRSERLAQEFHVRADLPQIAYRKLRQAHVDRGFSEVNEVTAQRLAMAILGSQGGERRVERDL